MTILVVGASEYVQPKSSDELNDSEAENETSEFILGLIAEHDGLCFQSAGNDTIGEFTGVIEAVHCAVEIQQAMLGENKRARGAPARGVAYVSACQSDAVLS